MQRPRSITIVAWIFILTGALGIAHDLWPLLTPGAATQLAKLRADGLIDLAPAWVTRALAIIGGIYTLRGMNWARWLLAAWMLLHVIISALHSAVEVAMHCLIFAVLAYLLFRRSAAGFFRRTTAAH